MTNSQNTHNHFDTIDNYDDEIPAHIARYLREVKSQKIITILKQFLNDKKSSGQLNGIDLGCGTGEYVKYLQEKDLILSIDGLDFSKKQLELAKQKGLKNHFIHDSMSHISNAKDCYYDFSYAINSIHHLPSKEEQSKTLDEVFRILKPGGIFIIHEINIKNPLIRFYVNYIFPRIRNIDDGSEIWLTEKLVKECHFIIEQIDYFTFIPDFTPEFLMGTMITLDKILSHSPLSVFGAHVMYVLKKPE
ncbi:MAG: class I SAM-dependent methyltransferase [gamma proteobacterium symbiont of Taylorina sp.]|nr:class I SAM-dependent methyltransferase [gamma proteobacterium symbiont of Taylorina sp.]